jgi:hypothetical protein
MSVLGHLRTTAQIPAISALPSGEWTSDSRCDVRFVPGAEVVSAFKQNVIVIDKRAYRLVCRIEWNESRRGR